MMFLRRLLTTKIATAGIACLAIYFSVTQVYDLLNSENEIQLRHLAFKTLGDRAIQLGRVGVIGATRSLPTSVFFVPKRIYDNPELISCSDRIVAPPFDPNFESGVMVLHPTGSKYVGILIYSGRAPDFSLILESKDREVFFDQRFTFPNGAAAPSNDTWESKRAFEEFIGNEKFRWQSTECKLFTYTLLWRDQR